MYVQRRRPATLGCAPGSSCCADCRSAPSRALPLNYRGQRPLGGWGDIFSGIAAAATKPPKPPSQWGPIFGQIATNLSKGVAARISQPKQPKIVYQDQPVVMQQSSGTSSSSPGVNTASIPLWGWASLAAGTAALLVAVTR